MNLRDWKAEASEYREVDQSVLAGIRLRAKRCPQHDTELQPAALYKDVWLCVNCGELWYLPPDKGEQSHA